jgi:hypothetical protein
VSEISTSMSHENLKLATTETELSGDLSKTKEKKKSLFFQSSLSQ